MSIDSQMKLLRIYQDDPSQAIADITRLRESIDGATAEITRLRAEVEQHKQEALSFHSIGCELSEENDRLRSINAEFLALVRRVHAECWPVEMLYVGGVHGTYRHCIMCTRAADTVEHITHADDCLWLAAEAALKKAGEL